MKIPAVIAVAWFLTTVGAYTLLFFSQSENRRLRRRMQGFRSAAESLWVTLANVSGGDWTKQSDEWREAAIRSRDQYFAAEGIGSYRRGIEAREKAAVFDALEFLRDEDGATVTLCCQNPDFDGRPDNVVYCCGDWTGWAEKEFGGRTLLEALEKAAAEKRTLC